MAKLNTHTHGTVPSIVSNEKITKLYERIINLTKQTTELDKKVTKLDQKNAKFWCCLANSVPHEVAMRFELNGKWTDFSMSTDTWSAAHGCLSQTLPPPSRLHQHELVGDQRPRHHGICSVKYPAQVDRHGGSHFRLLRLQCRVTTNNSPWWLKNITCSTTACISENATPKIFTTWKRRDRL